MALFMRVLLPCLTSGMRIMRAVLLSIQERRLNQRNKDEVGKDERL